MGFTRDEKRTLMIVLLYVLLFTLLITLVCTAPIFWPKIERELTKNKLVTPEPTKVRYTNIEDLFYNLYYSVNDYVYTIIEDGLVEEYYYALYNAEDKISLPEVSWYVYDLAVNNQYCMYNRVDNYCYVSKDEIKTEILLKYTLEDYFDFYNVGKVEYNDGEIVVYETRASAEFQQIVEYASIIIQGPDTPGYEEALQASYDIAERNGSYRLYYFKEQYPRQLLEYSDQINELNDMSVAEILDEYREYETVINIIEAYISIM